MRQILVIEKAAIFASLVLEFSLVFAEHVHANRVVVFRYWTKQLHNINFLPKPPMKDTDGISRHRLSPYTVYYH